MKKFFKGCLFTFLSLLVIAVIGIAYSLYQLDKPSERRTLESPINHKSILEKLKFKNLEVNRHIKSISENDIIYQTLEEENGLDYRLAYTVIFRTKKPFKLNKPLPFSKQDLSNIEKELNPLRIENNQINLNKNMELTFDQSKGCLIKTFSNPKIQNNLLNLDIGTYQNELNAIDKIGMAKEIIVFDEKHSLVLYKRTKYDAFQ